MDEDLSVLLVFNYGQGIEIKDRPVINLAVSMIQTCTVTRHVHIGIRLRRVINTRFPVDQLS